MGFNPLNDAVVDHEDREYIERRPLVTKFVRKKGFEVISDPIYNKARPQTNIAHSSTSHLSIPRHRICVESRANILRILCVAFAPDDKFRDDSAPKATLSTSPLL
jgi:hypothetical protein